MNSYGRITLANILGNYPLMALQTAIKTSEPRASFCCRWTMKCENKELNPQENRHVPRAELATMLPGTSLSCVLSVRLSLSRDTHDLQRKGKLTSLLQEPEFHDDFCIDLIRGLLPRIQVCMYRIPSLVFETKC